MTSSFSMIAMAILAGAAIGTIYLGLLWRAVAALARQRGALVFVVLGVARAGLVMGALALAVALEMPPAAIAAGLAGFIAVRLVLTRIVGSTLGQSPWK